MGELLVAWDEAGLRNIRFPEEGEADVPAQWQPAASDTFGVAQQLAEYFDGRRQWFDLPLAPQGSGFQLRVWAQLSAIPYGETRSYGDIAVAIGQPGAARAVGMANNANRLPIVVPCHRVIGTDGTLTGFGGGLPRKRWLLDLEHPALSLGL